MLAALATVTTVAGHWPTLAASPRSAVVLIVLAGLAAAASWLCGYRALQLTTVSNAYPLDKLSVVFAVLLAALFLGDRPSLTHWVGIATILLGAYLVTRPG